MKKGYAKDHYKLKCPICDGHMQPMQWECEDGSGWVFGWLCGCNDATRNG
jgi:hypothetical protein